MSKFTKQQRQELKSLVANAMIRRLDVFETQKYIHSSLVLKHNFFQYFKLQGYVTAERRPQIYVKKLS
jgi:hypothetical protein